MKIEFKDFKALCGLGAEETFGSALEDEAKFQLGRHRFAELMVRPCHAVSLSLLSPLANLIDATAASAM